MRSRLNCWAGGDEPELLPGSPLAALQAVRRKAGRVVLPADKTAAGGMAWNQLRLRSLPAVGEQGCPSGRAGGGGRRRRRRQVAAAPLGKAEGSAPAADRLAWFASTIARRPSCNGGREAARRNGFHSTARAGGCHARRHRSQVCGHFQVALQGSAVRLSGDPARVALNELPR